MVITFVSNYINHHQLPFCRAMLAMGSEVEFYFVQTMPMEEKRKNMGWAVDEKELPFLVLSYEEPDRAKELIADSDVVLFGWTEDKTRQAEQERISAGKLTFRMSERLYREGQWKAISPKGLMNKYRDHTRFRKEPVYLLCTGAYVASDFSLIHAYPGKMFKWGYFPEVETPAGKIEELKKIVTEKRPIRLCWAGRLIDLKHPEFAVRLAEKLQSLSASEPEKYDFTMDIVGDGPLLGHLREQVRNAGLEDKVHFAGGVKPSKVLDFMSRSDIFLFTSNYLEGWGAVVNEAMGNACAVIGSSEAGSVPFLIESGRNGLAYKRGDYGNFETQALSLFEKPEKIAELAKEASETIANVWNARKAASELVRFCKQTLDGEPISPVLAGPMSPAVVIKAPGIVRTFGEKNRLE